MEGVKNQMVVTNVVRTWVITNVVKTWVVTNVVRTWVGTNVVKTWVVTNVVRTWVITKVLKTCEQNPLQKGTKIFQYCTCPTGRVTYNFHLSCKHMHLPVSFKSACNKEHTCKGVICNMTYKVPYISHC